MSLSSIFDCCHDHLQLLLADVLGYSSKTLTLFTALCSSIVNKGFLLFFILSALPPSTFCLWKPWFVVRSLQLVPGWSPPLLPQSQLQMKNLWLYALKTSHSIWSAAVPLMLPPLMETASAVFIQPLLFLTVGVQIRERGAGQGPRLYTYS